MTSVQCETTDDICVFMARAAESDGSVSSQQAVTALHCDLRIDFSEIRITTPSIQTFSRFQQTILDIFTQFCRIVLIIE